MPGRRCLHRREDASEKLEIIRIVEQSHLPAKQTLDKLGTPRNTFYRWYDRYQTEGPEALEDRSPMPSRVWNRIPDNIRGQIVDLARDWETVACLNLVSFTMALTLIGPLTRSNIILILWSCDNAFIVIANSSMSSFESRGSVLPELKSGISTSATSLLMLVSFGNN